MSQRNSTNRFELLFSIVTVGGTCRTTNEPRILFHILPPFISQCHFCHSQSNRKERGDSRIINFYSEKWRVMLCPLMPGLVLRLKLYWVEELLLSLLMKVSNSFSFCGGPLDRFISDDKIKCSMMTLTIELFFELLAIPWNFNFVKFPE